MARTLPRTFTIARARRPVTLSSKRPSRSSLHHSSMLVLAAFALSLRLPLVSAATFQGDTDALHEFKAAVENPSALSWPDSGGDPCIDGWSHVTCTRDAITQEHRISSLLIDGLNLGGGGSPFPTQLARLAYMRALFIGNNGFAGEIPRELGELARMEQLGLDHNGFTSAPQDLFANMTALEALYLQSNPLGGQPPPDLSANTNLNILLLTNCSFTGELPSYLASLVALTNVSLGLNAFDGGIPEGMFGAHMPSLLSLRLNNNRLTGPIPASLASAPLLSELWLHGNDLSGPIPDALGGPLSLLQSVKVYENGLVGMLPESLGEARQLSELQVQRNKLVGPIPAFMERFGEGSWGENGWCAAGPGDACSDEAMALLEFLIGVEYAPALSDSWVANDPCASGSAGNSLGDQSSSATWLGVGCSADGQVTSLTIPSQNLNGTISVSLARLPALEMLQLPDNNLEGSLPAELAQLPALRAVNVANNQLTGPLPDFPPQVTVVATGNKLEGGGSAGGDASAAAPPPSPSAPSPTSATPSLPPPTSDTSRTASSAPGASASSPQNSPPPPDASAPALSTPLIAVIAVAAALLLLLVTLCAGMLGMRYWRGKGGSGGRKGAAAVTSQVLPSVAPSPHTSAAFSATSATSSAPYSSATENAAGGGYSAALGGAGGAASGSGGGGGSGWGSVSGRNMGGGGGDVVLNLGAWAGSSGGRSGSGGLSMGSGSMGSGGNMGSAGAGMSGMVMRMDVIRAATGGFAAENIIGKGGFGTVYKGELADGTGVAVKRMEVQQLAKKGDSEFQAEIEVLSSVRHRHLLGLLGYAVEGNERVLVYQLMARGPLSRHLFDHRRLALPPLTWRARVSVALDVARGVEYLHSLAHTSFIHRDLKASNILLDEGMRARVADFGLVKHSKGDGMQSIETRIAGTFGYLAPEYAVTGRVTTRSDVYSYGVVLMELITGRRALDDSKADEAAHLATWLAPLVPLRDQLAKVVDPVLLPEMPEAHGSAHGYGGVFPSVCAVADLAVTCVARDPRQRPTMGGVVGVLAPLLQQQEREEEEARKEHSNQVAEEDVSVAGIDLGVSLAEALLQWQHMDAQGPFDIPACASGEPVSWTKGGSFIIKRIGDQLEDVLVEKGACKRGGRGDEETKGLLLCAEDSLRGSDGCDAEGFGSEAERVRKGAGVQTQQVADIGAGRQRGREGGAAGGKLMSEVVVGAGVRRGGGGEQGGGNVKGGVGGGMSLAEQYVRQGSWEGGSSDGSARSIPTFIQPRLALSGR
ncbi:unnamed protein product [Closterium sp. NIES-64]|nr:unnamed protein product [Closterium sp. NIES-64]